MKKIISLIVISLLVISSTFSQITDGHISYSIVISTDLPEMESLIPLLDNSTMEIYFVKDKVQSEMNMMNMMNVTTITNSKSNEILMLMDGNDQKNAYKNKTDATERKLETPKMVYSDETKLIQDFLCKKAVSIDSNGVESTYWYTDKIKVNLEGQAYFNAQLPGFPLEFEIKNNGIIMLLSVSKIEEKIAKDKLKTLFLETIPEGYTLVTEDDIKKMAGQ